MKAEIKVLQPGLFSTIQDFGRYGFLRYGVPVSGPMDSFAYKTANLILKNQLDAAVLEITQMGPKLEFSAPARIAIGGADLSPMLNSSSIENYAVIRVEEGDVLSFGRPKKGIRAYLAIAGGFKTEEVLKSRSWYEGLTGSFRLEKNMRLAFEASEEEKYETHSSLKVKTQYLTDVEFAAYPGPEFGFLTEEQQELLTRKEFLIGPKNSRMAIQLKEKLTNRLKPIITGPVIPGTVQLTPSGKLIVLMRDCQTTGGYPRVLQISEEGINILAQKKTGDVVKFKNLMI